MKSSTTHVAAAAILTILLGGCKESPSEKANSDAKRDATALQEEMKRQVESGKSDTAKLQEMQSKALNSLDKASGEMPADQAKKMRAMLGVIQGMQTERMAYEGRASAIMNSGPLKPEALATDEKITATIDELTWIIDETKRLQTYTLETPKRLDTALTGAGASAAEVKQVLADQAGGGRFTLMSEILGFDQQVYTSLRTILSTLKANRAGWSVEGGKLTYKDAEIERKVEAAFTEIDTATAAQQAAEKKLLELAR